MPFLIQACHLAWENYAFPCWQQPETPDKRHWNAPGARKAGNQPPAQLSGTDLAQSDRNLQNLPFIEIVFIVYIILAPSPMDISILEMR